MTVPYTGRESVTQGGRTDFDTGAGSWPTAPPPSSVFIRTLLLHLAPWPLPREDADASAGFIKDLLPQCLSGLGYRSSSGQS